MMARKALIDKDGLVVNVILADDDFRPPEGLTMRDADRAGPGWMWDGKEFHPPEPAPEPEPTARELAIQEAIKDEPADSPVRLLGEALLGKTATEIEVARREET